MDDRPTILILDDQQEIAEILGLLLQEHFECSPEHHVHLAQERLKTQAFDFAITDLEMPEMSGIDFIKQMKPQCTQTCFIVSTGHDSAHPKVREALAAGAAGILVKPFTDVAEIARILCESRRIQRGP
ncbi:MAG: response regulator [Oligoflexus sp.]|jgi:DNA-binding NtrC family response regulator